MNGEVMTNERGGPSKAEANIQVALKQGRIAQAEIPQWRERFGKDYERAMGLLLERPVNPNAAVRSYSEEAYRDYAIRTGVAKPYEIGPSYVRSVV